MRHLLLAAALFATPALAGTPLPDAPHVVAAGEGRASAAPDIAHIRLAARHRDASAAVAKQAVDRAVDAFIALAPRFALTPEQVTASDLSVSEDVGEDERGRRVPRGAVATREVRIELRQPARLGELLDAALAAGMNDVEDIRFESSRAAALREQARRQAVAQAREKAEGLATAFGGALGPVYSINSLNSAASHGYGAALDRIEVTGSRGAPSRYLQPRVEYSERVSAVFELRRP